MAFVFSDDGELLDDVDHSVERVVCAGDIAGDGLGALVVVFDQVEVADDNSEKVVEVVCDALGDGSDGGGFACVAESFLKLEVLAVHLLKAEVGMDAGEGFFEVDGLGDVIDCAGLKAFEFVFFSGSGRNK